MGINLYRPVEAGAEEIRLKVYNTGKQVALLPTSCRCWSIWH